jgi:hypothetical protein
MMEYGPEAVDVAPLVRDLADQSLGTRVARVRSPDRSFPERRVEAEADELDA